MLLEVKLSQEEQCGENDASIQTVQESDASIEKV